MEIEHGLEEKVEALMSSYQSSLPGYLGIQFTSLSRSLLEAEMPVDERTKQPFGILHGGASVALSETIASVGGWLNVDKPDLIVVGAEINANHLRPVSSGRVKGQGRPIHLGRSLQVWEVSITDDADKQVCISRCTLAVQPKR